MATCPLHPDGSPTGPEWSADQCVHCFRIAGGVVPKSPRVAGRKPLTACSHLGVESEKIGQRNFRTCSGGHGSTHPVFQGKVCTCGMHDPGGLIWRLGKECGPSCPGFALSPADPN